MQQETAYTELSDFFQMTWEACPGYAGQRIWWKKERQSSEVSEKLREFAEDLDLVPVADYIGPLS